MLVSEGCTDTTNQREDQGQRRNESKHLSLQGICKVGLTVICRYSQVSMSVLLCQGIRQMLHKCY